MLLILLKKVERIFEKWWQCSNICQVESISRLQLHKGLIQLRWLRPTLNLVRSFSPIGLSILWTQHWLGRLTFQQSISKYSVTLRFSNIQIKFFPVNYCVKKKKEFLNSSVFKIINNNSQNDLNFGYCKNADLLRLGWRDIVVHHII